MEKEQRTRLQKATQDARRLLEEEFRSQLLQTYDIDVDKVRWAEEPGAHLQAEQRLIREKLIAWIEHKEAQINDRKEALLLALREMAFTALNRFVALKLMEARDLVRPCVSGGLESAGFLEFTAVAEGLLTDQESSYRLYLETIFEDVSRELRALFDPRDAASLLWPKRATLLELLDILNRPELAELWIEDETLGWVYQYFNGNDVRAMRDAVGGGSPRNGRELAVRNQFFTPRYVVEFLADNTLGRIWMEMLHGKTRLTSFCKYLPTWEASRNPAESLFSQQTDSECCDVFHPDNLTISIPVNPIKDPRSIRMLDPACGSMHFGLYAFDLYLKIYEEAWDIAKSSNKSAEQGFLPFIEYANSYNSKDDFLAEVPRLILKYNIHGIDIDARATQIARLTLWMRAQRAWKEIGLSIQHRPSITESNIVCAEPMPGETDLLSDFCAEQFPAEESDLYYQLLESIIARMRIAGETGSLLKINSEIKQVIEEAEKMWKATQFYQRCLHLDAVSCSSNKQIDEDFSGTIDGSFWLGVEKRIYESLQSYAEKVDSYSDFRRRLFSKDAAQGFAFIDVSLKRYDVILMNPPFGEPSRKSVDYLKSEYPESRFDIFAAFVELGLGLLVDESIGRLGIISSRAGFFLSSLENWRRKLLKQTNIETWLDQGFGVLDSGLDSAATYTIANKNYRSPTWIVSWLDADPELRDKSIGSLNKISASGTRVFTIKLDRFLETPGATFCYWLQEKAIFHLIHSPRFKASGRDVRQGMASGDNFRFVRLFWEVPSHSLGYPERWVPYAKGGDYSPIYRDVELCIDWLSNGRQVKTLASDQYGSETRTIKSQDKYFNRGLTFTTYTKKGFNIRPLPQGCIFDVSGSSIFVEDAGENDLFYLLGFCSSPVFQYFISALSDDRKWQVGLLQNVPWIEPCESDRAEIISNTRKAYEITSSLSSLDETDHFHKLSGLGNENLHSFASKVEQRLREAIIEVNLLRDRNTGIICRCYGLDPLMLARKPSFSPFESLNHYHIEIGFEWDGVSDAAYLFISHLLGIAFGRWDARISVNSSNNNRKPNAFGTLPSVPEGCLALADTTGSSISSSGAYVHKDSYPLDICLNGILVNDEQSPHDATTQICNAANFVWGKQGVQILEEICVALGIKSARDCLDSPSHFFSNHLKRYSKSRRQAPIYWQLSAGSGSYSSWLYYHCFTNDTLYRVLRDFVEPRIQQVEREQFELESQGALSGDAAVRLQEAQTLLQDLRILKSELDLVAPLWNPNLNDGVIINHAILWRITPYTPWQKKCKECWDKLAKGDYDWAHLAFHLWPERVIPKCTTDRSLAIAHGLEERLWQETNNGNWLPRQLSEADLQALIAEHSNPAVKSALERFLAAPPPAAPTRTRASRSTRSTGSSAPRRPRGTAAVVDAEATRQVLLALTAAPSEGLAKAAIADLVGVEANALTAVIKQLKESGQIDQLGERRGARYVLSEQGRAAVASEHEVEA